MADTVQSWLAVPDNAKAPARKNSMQRFMRRRSTIALAMCTPLILIVGGLIIYRAVSGVR
jgi:hypothetical protein